MAALEELHMNIWCESVGLTSFKTALFLSLGVRARVLFRDSPYLSVNDSVWKDDQCDSEERPWPSSSYKQFGQLEALASIAVPWWWMKHGWFSWLCVGLHLYSLVWNVSQGHSSSTIEFGDAWIGDKSMTSLVIGTKYLILVTLRVQSWSLWLFQGRVAQCLSHTHPTSFLRSYPLLYYIPMFLSSGCCKVSAHKESLLASPYLCEAESSHKYLSLDKKDISQAK